MDQRSSPSDYAKYMPGLQKIVLKLKGKKSGLYVKNMYGTRAFGQPETILKTSSLAREMLLRTGMKMAKRDYCYLKSIGMLRWPAFKEQRDSINHLIQIIRHALDAYKKRRVERGLFYLRSCPNNPYGFSLYTHLLHMPLKEALKRRRLEMKKRRQFVASYNKNACEASASKLTAAYARDTAKKVFGKMCTTNLMTYTIISIFVGCVIVLVP
ncbi:hypothetical protein EJB05_40202 [Eragrostis curvula]|uniref:Uncharacterized protein n=1 Tax=Eragrostis curvula TaxID=38414 RepID=A0A5J9TZ17_9POAL|nr:hypothetical protein EJB05_40202 [Eragrostis curvula]